MTLSLLLYNSPYLYMLIVTGMFTVVKVPVCHYNLKPLPSNPWKVDMLIQEYVVYFCQQSSFFFSCKMHAKYYHMDIWDPIRKSHKMRPWMSTFSPSGAQKYKFSSNIGLSHLSGPHWRGCTLADLVWILDYEILGHWLIFF